ncbi:MAG: hypothetical protein JRC92_03830 [Deltaproteobacteria bacterium]|nr:hypothetical protein [Deltaproteobacteria bacterium]
MVLEAYPSAVDSVNHGLRSSTATESGLTRSHLKGDLPELPAVVVGFKGEDDFDAMAGLISMLLKATGRQPGGGRRMMKRSGAWKVGF